MASWRRHRTPIRRRKSNSRQSKTDSDFADWLDSHYETLYLHDQDIYTMPESIFILPSGRVKSLPDAHGYVVTQYFEDTGLYDIHDTSMSGRATWAVAHGVVRGTEWLSDDGENGYGIELPEHPTSAQLKAIGEIAKMTDSLTWEISGRDLPLFLRPSGTGFSSLRAKVKSG